MGARHFRTLDGLRGVAALAVILLHAETLLGRQVAPSGYLAVDLFFVLSGFVVAHAYEDRLAAGLSPGRFITLRAVRFYPLYLAGLALGAIKCLAVIAARQPTTMPPGAVGPAVALGMFFLPAPFAPPDFNIAPLNIPAWSLMFELLINAAFAVLLIRLPTRALIAIVIASGLFFAAAVITHGDASLGTQVDQLGSGFARTLASFGVGVLLHRRPLVLRVHPAIPLSGCAVLLFANPGQYRAAYDILFIAVASPLLVAAGAASEPTGKLAWICGRLGLASFFAYAVHYPLLWLARGLQRGPLQGAGVEMCVAIVAGLVIAAPYVDRYYDQPFRRWLSSRLLRFAPAAEA